MKIASFISTLAILCLMTASSAQADAQPKHALDFQMKNIEGKPVNLSDHIGEVVLLVNVASKCGYTPQYAGLQKIHEQYGAKGFKVIGFPCNNFGGQEPGTHEEIVQFCDKNYGVTFPLMAKIDVKGDAQAPLYKYLTGNAEHGGEIRWNFEKFLVDRKGRVVGHYPSRVKPESEEMTSAIEKALAEK